MRVLLASTNRSQLTVPPFPLGLACVVANTDGQRHEVAVWDAMFQEDWEASLRACLRDFRPDVIGFSVRNVDDQDMRHPRLLVDEVRQMAAVCREEAQARLVLGGSGFGMFPAELLAYVGADFGVVGDGERAFPQLLECLEAGRNPDGVPGVVWLANGRLCGTPPVWEDRLDDLRPADHCRLDVVRYHEARGTAGIPNSVTVQTKRGCPLGCTYCATRAIEGTAIRTRSPIAVVEELERLQAAGVRRIQFVDSIFTNPAWHARAICEEILRRRLNVQWSATLNPAFAGPDLLRLMQRAGCVLAIVGNESGCTRILTALGKGFGKAEVERCFAACQEIGLRYNAFLLLGGPGEDRDSVRESVELLQRFQPALVNVSIGIRLYPGCPLTQLARDEGQLPSGADLLTPRFYLAPAVRDWIFDYMDSIVAQDPRWTF